MTGHTVTHYRVGEKLGEGASAAVYRAEDLALGREVVIKFFASGDEGSSARFQHEARTISSLNHPNICTIYEIGEHEGRPFLVMEMLEGEVLSQAIAGRPLPIERLIDLATQIADALEAAHAEGIVHRDVKPQNIFLTRAGRIKLLDFGVAVMRPRRVDKAMAQSLSSAGGTIPYMSPEQARVEVLDHRSDLFSLGILLYEMATGRRPFAGATPTDVLSAIVSQPPIAPREIHAAIPAELDRIIAKALEKQPALRYQTASDVRADLQRLKRDLDRAGSGHGQAAALAALPPVRWSLWSRTTAAVGASVIVAAGWWVVAAARARSSASDSTAVLRGPVRTSDVELPARVETLKDAATGVVAPPTSADSAARDTSPAADYLLVARRQIDLKLYDQALDNLRKVAQDTHQQTAIEASFLMASVYESRDDRANAMGTYIEIAHRFPASSRAAEALAKLAESTMKSRQRDKEHDARRTLTELVTKYPRSPWAPRALLMRGDIEARQGTAQPDALLGGSVPTAAVTYREIGDRYPSSDSAPSALNKLARIYTETKRYELAAATFERLAAHDANDRYGAWFAAGEIYEKRLKDQTRARAAYSRVRPSSPQYAQARKRISR